MLRLIIRVAMEEQVVAMFNNNNSEEAIQLIDQLPQRQRKQLKTDKMIQRGLLVRPDLFCKAVETWPSDKRNVFKLSHASTQQVFKQVWIYTF